MSAGSGAAFAIQNALQIVHVLIRRVVSRVKWGLQGVRLLETLPYRWYLTCTGDSHLR